MSKAKRLPESKLLAAPDLDRLAAVVFELAAQLHVERQRRMALETLLVAKGFAPAAELEALAEDPRFLVTTRAAADRSLRKIMRILTEDGDKRRPLRGESR
jgi:hypothetical protein